MKHTPGPWEISRDAVPKGHVQITVYAEHDGERVATVFREEANARLIAAAPELLEACKAFEQFKEHYIDECPVLIPSIDRVCLLVEQAIAKAEGQEIGATFSSK